MKIKKTIEDHFTCCRDRERDKKYFRNFMVEFDKTSEAVQVRELAKRIAHLENNDANNTKFMLISAVALTIIAVGCLMSATCPKGV